MKQLFEAVVRLNECGYTIEPHAAHRAKRIYFRLVLPRLAELPEEIRPFSERVQNAILLMCQRGCERNEVVAAAAIARERMESVQLQAMHDLFCVPAGQKRACALRKVHTALQRTRGQIIREEATRLAAKFRSRGGYGVRRYITHIREVIAAVGNFKSWQ